MKRRNKGRKIYKTKEKNYYGKSPMGKFLSGALTVLLIGGIGFLGYSAAEPIINYTKHKGDEPEITEPSTETPTEEATVPPTEAPTADVTEAAAVVHYSAAALKPEDMVSEEALRAALDNIPNNGDVEFVQVPLKVSGGNLYFATDLLEAKKTGVISSELPLSQIKGEIENKGFKAAAYISVFADNITPLTYTETGYIKSDDGSQWLDKNGKPWTSPYSQRILDINSNIVKEIADAGYEEIICADFVFPEFTENDLLELDPVLSQNDRCISMTSAANLLYEKVFINGGTMRIETSADDVIKGRTDILRPMLLSTNNIILNIDLDKLKEGVAVGDTVVEFKGNADEIIEKCLDTVKDQFEEFNVAVRISGASRSFDELLDAKIILEEKGYEDIIIG